MIRSLKQVNDRVRRPAWLAGLLLAIGTVLIWLVLIVSLAGTAAFGWASRQLLPLAWSIAVAGALWLAPGLAALRLLGQERYLSWVERLTLALGIGIALPPLLLELAHVVHLPWNAWITAAYVMVAATVALYPARRPSWRFEPRKILAYAWPAFWLAGITALTLLQRLYVVRDLTVGMWGDSYQHTMITQLIVDNQGLFSSWKPYAALATFTYHFGFHANAAMVHWLSGYPVTQSVLWTGQLLNVATVPAAYLLTVRLSGNRMAGLWAALLTAFVNIQPAYYFNWGRYSQLAGQVVLPVVLVAWMNALGRPRLQWTAVVLAAGLSACLALTHYIVTIYAALFVLAYVVALVVRQPDRSTILRVGLGSAAIGSLSLVLAAPWLANTLSGFLVRNSINFVNGVVAPSRIASYATLQPIDPLYLKPYLMVLAALGTLVALARRKWTVALLPVWVLLLLFTVVPNLVGLPGAGVIDYFAVYIALYLPVIPAAAYFLGEMQTLASGPWPRVVAALAGAIWIALSAFGFAWQQNNLLVRQYELFTAADARAVSWITANTPAEAHFFVNAFPAFGGSLVAGSDGGWWLPLLAGRQTNLPPLTYGSERGQVEGFSRQVNALAAMIRGRPLADDKAISIDLTTSLNHALLLGNGFSYVYIGAHANPGADSADHIDTSTLGARPDLFQLVYDQDGVLIFHIVSPP